MVEARVVNFPEKLILGNFPEISGKFPEIFIVTCRHHSYFLPVTSLSELFSEVAARSIVDFLKETGFYSKI
jgi:hypothetical protein